MHYFSGALQRLLALDAFSPQAFREPAFPRANDYVGRALEVARARAQGRNPPLPVWVRRSVARWQLDGDGPGPRTTSRSGRPVIYGVTSVWNEEDIVYALVTHLFAQGLDRVYVIDDASDDATREEASAAGARVISFSSDGTYSDAVRTERIRQVVASETQKAGGDVWWLVVDADEFPRGPDGASVRDLVEHAPVWVDVVGSRVLDHLPRDPVGYVPRSQPFDFLPLAHWYRTPYCPRGHWKHPLMRVRTSGDLIPMAGHHTVGTRDGRRAREYGSSLLTHHFPLRNHERTAAKLRSAAAPGGRYSASPDRFTRWRLAHRLSILDDLYAARYDRVPSGFPDDVRIGITVKRWQDLVAPAERKLL